MASAVDLQSALLPPTLRVACAPSQRRWPGLWGPEIRCVWDTANTLFHNVGTFQRLVKASEVPPASDRLKCQLIGKHHFEYNAEYRCRLAGPVPSCVHNTSVWLSNVLSPVAEFDLTVPNVRSFVDLSHLPCEVVQQVLNCPGLPLNGSFYETAADVSDDVDGLLPIRCFLTYSLKAAEEMVTTVGERVRFWPSTPTTDVTSPAVSRGSVNLTQMAFDSRRPADVEDVWQLMNGSYDWWFLCVLLFVLAGAVGNLLVCFAVVLDRRLHNVTNYFLFSLAIADLLVSLVVMPLGAIPLFIGYWPLSLAWCKVYVTCDVLACSSSILHMCFISFGRYSGIQNPLGSRHSSTKRRIFVKIAIVWLMAMLVCSSITGLALLDERNIMPEAHTCAINNRAFFVLGSLVTFYIPMVVMVSTYAATIRLLSKKAKFAQLHPDSDKWRSVKTAPNKRSTTSPPSATHKYSTIPDARRSLLNRNSSTTGNFGGDHHRNATYSMLAAPKSNHQPPPSRSSNDSRPSETGNNADRPTGPSQLIRHSTSHGGTVDQATQTSLKMPKRPNDKLNNTITVDLLATTTTSSKTPNGNSKQRPDAPSPSPPPLNKNPPTRLQLRRFLNNRSKRRSGMSANAVASEQKATKVLGIVFFTFVLCWSPFFILNIVFAAHPHAPIPDRVVSLCLWLGYVSSTINPIIYTIFNRIFRAAFIRLLRCDCKVYSNTPHYRSVTDSSSKSTSGGTANAFVGGGQQQQQQPQSAAATGSRNHGHQQLLLSSDSSPLHNNRRESEQQITGRRLAEFGGSYVITDDEC